MATTPIFMQSVYVPTDIPHSLNRFSLGDSLAPAPAVGGATVRPAKGQGFPIGGQR